MLEKATGLVIRTRRLTETSLIVHWLTPALGRLATVAKGALRPHSPFRGKLDLFYSADFSFTRSQRSDLHNLREVSLRNIHPLLRTELGYLQQACYFTELIEKLTETETPLAEIHSLLEEALASLPGQASAPASVFAFELKLLELLGLFPDLDAARLRPGTTKLLQALASGPWDQLRGLVGTAAEESEMRLFLQRCLSMHLNRMPAERDAALGRSSSK